MRALLLVAAIAVAGQANAKVCMTREAVLKMAADQFHEVPVLAGVTRGGSVLMELLVSPERTWTIIWVYPDDCAVIVSSGMDLVNGDVPPAGKGM